MINYKNAIYKKLIRHNESHLKLHLRYFHTKTKQAKNKYFENISHKLSNKNLKSKKYCPKKIPCIFPIYYNDKFVPDIKK